MGLTNLTELLLGGNSISDISAVSSLTNLTRLWLWSNTISDLSHLVANTGLGDGDEVDVRRNPLNAVSINTHIPTLQRRGATVQFDVTLHAATVSIDPSSVESPVSGEQLTLNINITGGMNVAGYEVTVTFDPTALSYVNNSNGDYLPANAFVVPTTTTETSAKLAATAIGATSDGEGTLATVTFTAVEAKDSMIGLEVVVSDPTASPINVTVQGGTIIGPTGPTTTKILAVQGTITNTNGSPAEGLEVTVTVGSNPPLMTIPDADGFYSVLLIALSEVVAKSGDTVEVQVVHQATGESASSTVQLSAEQILAMTATIDLTIDLRFKEFLLSVPTGTSLIHIPLKVTTVDGAERSIESIADLYDVLGGAATVNLLSTHDNKEQQWASYLGTSDTGTAADKELTDDTGILTGLKKPVSLRLGGAPLGANGSSTITLLPGSNCIGLPLKDSRIARVSDLFALEGRADNVSGITVLDSGDFKRGSQVGDDGDIPVMGGQAFVVTAQRAATVIPFLKNHIALSALRKYENEVILAMADLGKLPRISLNCCCIWSNV